MPYQKDYVEANNERWSHPDAIETGDSDYYIYYNCPNCGLHFKVELPE